MKKITTTPQTPVKGRIRPALARAIRLIVEDGLSQVDAAAAAGMSQVSLSIALRKPHVKALRAAVKDAWLTNKTGRAWLTIANLAENATSEDARLKAAKIFLEAAGELTPRDTEGRISRPMVNIIISSPQGESAPQQLPGVIEARVQHVRPSDRGGVIEAPAT